MSCPLMNRGNVMVLLHRNGEARRDYLAAISLKPAQAELHYLLARLDHSEGRLGAAAKGYRRALYYEPDHAYARQSLADVLDELKR